MNLILLMMSLGVTASSSVTYVPQSVEVNGGRAWLEETTGNIPVSRNLPVTFSCIDM